MKKSKNDPAYIEALIDKCLWQARRKEKPTDTEYMRYARMLMTHDRAPIAQLEEAMRDYSHDTITRVYKILAKSDEIFTEKYGDKRYWTETRRKATEYRDRVVDQDILQRLAVLNERRLRLIREAREEKEAQRKLLEKRAKKRAYNKTYYERHPEKMEERRAKMHAYNREHPEIIKERNARSKAKIKAKMAVDPEYAAKMHAQWHTESAKQYEKIKARMESDPEYADKIRAYRKEQRRKSYAKMKARMAEDPEYAAMMKEKVRKHNAEQRAKRKEKQK